MGAGVLLLKDVIKEKLTQSGPMTSIDLSTFIYVTYPEIKKKYKNFKTLTRNIQHALCTVIAFEFIISSKKGKKKLWSYNPEKPLKRKSFSRNKKMEEGEIETEAVNIHHPPPPSPDHLFLWYDKEHILFGK